MKNRESFSLNKESLEKGANVYIDVKFIRHGERTPEGQLLDFGREVTKAKAAEADTEKFDLVRIIGSDAGNSKGVGMRALETATIYAEEVADDNLGSIKVEKTLNYETLVTPPPYSHEEVYASALPENFEELSDEEKAVASRNAQAYVLNHLANLSSPEAMTFKKELAGSFASILLHYIELAGRVKSGSNIQVIAGTHGGTMEFLLQQALVDEDDNDGGIGFTDMTVIGGEFGTSESYDVHIMTDESGKLGKLAITFAETTRPQGKIYLDLDTVKELAAFYEDLHTGK